MATLSEEQLTIVRLSFFEGKAHGEISDNLGIPLGTVKSRLRLAMRHLRKLLEEPQ
jgi:RNA polymerase sigma-70 factor (ECF subfamily)